MAAPTIRARQITAGVNFFAVQYLAVFLVLLVFPVSGSTTVLG